MNAEQRKKLEAAGFAIGDTQEFLNLSDEEMAYIEIKRALSQHLREKRKSKKLTQSQAAKLMHTSQSRFAKMEHAEKTVSIDLLVRANLALGATPGELKHAL
ncbi:helix-turn-helix domain-containing protein [Pontiella agarivorans]|uniref:Helix-turn-helix transcriptional regulator n=1 Tax=Pontiella agarivorans TaxID=3038953 RepID=A0ABU5MW93_9BACT|nr:helix-turn-helix transcriptional regulator [Pontiella agarivorans]MDZ8118489.1 helix-turn-helix transcriptional regulator [Pontiella agarivorans]